MATSDTHSAPSVDYREHVTLDDIPKEGQELLISYSGLTRERLVSHVVDIRNKAWKVSPYPCVGQVRFLGNRWPFMPYLEQAFLPKLRNGARCLDVGCGLGQDLRFLHHAYGIDSSQLYGTDLEQGLMDIGFDLFRDGRKFKATFFQADMLDPTNSLGFAQLKGTLDLIHASQFFHCWDWDESIKAATSVAGLSAGSGAIVFGTQVGSRNAGSYEILKSCSPEGRHFRHSQDSWTRFWEQVGSETRTKWQVDYHEIPSPSVEASRGAWWADPGMTMFWYSVTRTM